MKKALLLSATIFILGFVIFVFPSFVSRPGIDCLAGCASGRGFPLPYTTTYAGGIAGIPVTKTINYFSLAFDFIVLLLIGSIPISVQLFKKNKSSLNGLFSIIISLVIIFFLGFLILNLFLKTQLRENVTVVYPEFINKRAVACIADVKACPDGTYVMRVPPHCEFEMCPAP